MNPEIRKLFPVTQHHVYLNHAAVCPISLPVFEAMQGYARDLLEHGFVNFREWLDAIRRVREAAARFVNAQADEIAFAPNTSSGLSMIANGIGWQAGDNIVTAECEFPSNAQPWIRIGREFGVEIRRAKERDGRLETEEILALIDDRTRVVTLSFVEFGSGFRNNLAAIGRECRRRGVLFVVDAIQGLGALKLDVAACNIDAFSADSHKFLLGPDGVALMYVSRAAMPQIKPTMVGWLSVENPDDYFNFDQPYPNRARRYEPGALNTAGVMGLGASIDLFEKVGVETIENYLLGLGDYLCGRLQEKGYQVVSSRREGEKSAVICCRHDRHSADALYDLLNQHQIITTTRLGRLRISPHFYNTRDDIDRLIDVLPV